MVSRSIEKKVKQSGSILLVKNEKKIGFCDDWHNHLGCVRTPFLDSHSKAKNDTIYFLRKKMGRIKIPIYFSKGCYKDVSFLNNLLFATIYERENLFTLTRDRFYPIEPIDLSLIIK